MFRRCQRDEAGSIYPVINEAARAYQNVIPADRYHQPYMGRDELEREMERIEFYGWEADGQLVAVMGIEPVKGVTLIRHAYVLPEWQRRGIGSKMLSELIRLTGTECLLVGTWADATWAVDFYRKHGFSLMPDKDRLLKAYWDIPQRQIDTSVVLGMNLNEAAKE